MDQHIKPSGKAAKVVKPDVPSLIEEEEKREHLGIRDLLLEWTHSFLIGWKQRVVVYAQASPHSIVLSDVPQGTVFGSFFSQQYL